MKKRLLPALAFCAAGICQAEPVIFEPVLNTNQRYDSNLFMFQNPQQGNWISTLSPGANLRWRSEASDLKSNFTWNQLWYNNQSELDISEQLFSLDFKHQRERWRWDFSGSYNHQSSLNTESTGSGLLFSQVMSKRLNLAPSVLYAFNERNTLALDYAYYQAHYDQSQNLYLADYDYHQASATFNHLYSERDKLNATVSFSRYASVVQDQVTRNYVGLLGWQHSFSESLEAYVSAGVNYAQSQLSVAQFPLLGFNAQSQPVYLDTDTGLPTTQQRFAALEHDAFGQVYKAYLKKAFAQSTVSLSGSRDQTPTSTGLQTRTEFTLNYLYHVSERWTSHLSASYALYEITGQQTNPLNRSYYAISAGLNWHWTPEINLGFSYTFRQQEFQDSQQPSQGNIVQLQLSYIPLLNHQVK